VKSGEQTIEFLDLNARFAFIREITRVMRSQHFRLHEVAELRNTWWPARLGPMHLYSRQSNRRSVSVISTSFAFACDEGNHLVFCERVQTAQRKVNRRWAKRHFPSEFPNRQQGD